MVLQNKAPVTGLEVSVGNIRSHAEDFIGSINIMNGMLGLTFSCDGSHYMPVEEFLEKNLAFWIGELAADESSIDATNPNLSHTTLS